MCIGNRRYNGSIHWIQNQIESMKCISYAMATANIDDNTNVKFNLIISTTLIRLKSTTMNAKAQQECVTLIDFHVAETRSMRSARIQLKSHCLVNCIDKFASMWFVFLLLGKNHFEWLGLQIKIRTLGFSGLTISIFGPSISLKLYDFSAAVLFSRRFFIAVISFIFHIGSKLAELSLRHSCCCVRHCLWSNVVSFVDWSPKPSTALIMSSKTVQNHFSFNVQSF